MPPNGDLITKIKRVLEERFGDEINNYTFPPPILGTMHGEFLEFDLDAGLLKMQFPVLEKYLNPYGAMQGGMIAAAVDNTLGPLSVLVASPNVTRRLEMTYNRPVTLDMEFIVVQAQLIERQQNRLFFKADVRTCEGLRLARAKAMHWIFTEIGV